MSVSSSLKLAHSGLIIIGNHSPAAAVPLNRARIIIGREADCDLNLSDPMCSRHHAVILSDQYTVRIRDLGSHNGTFVNRKKILTTVVLNESDEIQIGGTRLVVCRMPTDATTATTVPAGSSNANPQTNDAISESNTAVDYGGKTKILF